MKTLRGRVVDLARRQHGVVAWWQLRKVGLGKGEIEAATRGLERVHRGVCAVGKITYEGWLMAAALAMGPGAAISHLSGVRLWGMRPWDSGEIHLTVPRGGGRGTRDWIIPHRSTRLERTRHLGIPVTTPTQSLIDARLQPHELYRALEHADREGVPIHRPSLPRDVARLQRTVLGRTRSDAEARFLLLCHDRGLELPRVNHRLNGFESDFHWREAQLVVEVDGWEFHRTRAQFEEDRRRGVAHRIAGYEVVRVSALQVEHAPDDVMAAVLAAAPGLTRARRGSARW